MLLAQARGWVPALTKVNTIPSGEIKQENQFHRVSKACREQMNSPSYDFRRNSLASLTFPVQLLARFCFARVTESRLLKDPGPASLYLVAQKADTLPSEPPDKRRQCLPTPGAWPEPLGGALGRGSSETMPHSEKFLSALYLKFRKRMEVFVTVVVQPHSRV